MPRATKTVTSRPVFFPIIIRNDEKNTKQDFNQVDVSDFLEFQKFRQLKLQLSSSPRTNHHNQSTNANGVTYSNNYKSANANGATYYNDEELLARARYYNNKLHLY
jgi:hypothetical protein